MSFRYIIYVRSRTYVCPFTHIIIIVCPFTQICMSVHAHIIVCPFTHITLYVRSRTYYCTMSVHEGSRPEWCISSVIYSRDTPFWYGTLVSGKAELQKYLSPYLLELLLSGVSPFVCQPSCLLGRFSLCIGLTSTLV